MTDQVEATTANNDPLVLQGKQLIDERSPTPLYHQVYLVLRNGILNGEFPDGSLLPGEQETTVLFGVSRITAKRALNDLAAEGLCVREKGRGTRVTHRVAVKPLKVDIEGLFENLQEMGLRTDVTLVRLKYLPAVPQIARILNLNVGDEVQRAVRLRHLDGEAFSYLTTYVPADIGKTFDGDDLLHTPLLKLIERSGIRIASAEQTITATLADGETAQALEVNLGAPLLQVNRIVYDSMGRAVEHICALYRPDRYQYRMSLARAGKGAGKIWASSEDREAH